MILHTFYPKMVEFWGERGIKAKKRYTLQKFTAWELDIPDDHPDLRVPDYIGLQVQEVTTVLPAVVRARLQPPVYTLKVGKFFADVKDSKGKTGVPITHNQSILAQMCNNPYGGESPDIVKLTKEKRIQDVLLKAHRQGTEALLFFALPGVCETVPIESALRVLKHL
jgi:hypothetical protein